VLKQALLQMGGSVLLLDFLPNRVHQPGAIGTPRTEPAAAAVGTAGAFDWDEFVGGRIAAGSEELYAESLERMEREVLVRVLRHTEGNQLQAARILGITRGSLRTKIRALGISIARSVWSDDDQGDS
jgi:two-component system nitrogen regulation response regulator GlnG